MNSLMLLWSPLLVRCWNSTTCLFPCSRTLLIAPPLVVSNANTELLSLILIDFTKGKESRIDSTLTRCKRCKTQCWARLSASVKFKSIPRSAKMVFHYLLSQVKQESLEYLYTIMWSQTLNKNFWCIGFSFFGFRSCSTICIHPALLSVSLG